MKGYARITVERASLKVAGTLVVRSAVALQVLAWTPALLRPPGRRSAFGDSQTRDRFCFLFFVFCFFFGVANA